jgi:hypothetical protein
VTSQVRDETPEQEEHPTFDTSVAHVARVYNYWLGGKDYYAADKAAGDAAIEAYPDLVASVRGNRAFLARAVRYLVKEAGIRQFLDIGTGIPSANNTHEVAQAQAPGSRVVYVDNDPVVLAHARALLTGSSEGATAYIEADLRQADAILSEAAQTLDFSRPVAVMVIAVLHMISDDDQPHDIVAKLMDAVPSGSYLALSHVARDIAPDQQAEAARRYNRMAHDKQHHRTHPEVTRFFSGLELVEPGIVAVQHWHPESDAQAKSPSAMWGGVGRKP